MSQNHHQQDKSLEETIAEMEAQFAGDELNFSTESASTEEVTKASSPKSDGQIIAELEQQLAEQRKRELQAQAELENFRKRMLRDSEQNLRYASVPLIRDLLSVADNLSRAIDASVKESSGFSEGNSLFNGVSMVHQQLRSTLAKYNCIPIEALGKEFDPNYHEAISQAPSNEYASGIVMYEATQGYRMFDRVVRPSQVIVSTGSVK